LKYLPKKFGKICGALLCVALLKTAPIGAQAANPAYRYTGDVSLDPGRVPFSRFGSYMAFSMMTDTRTVAPADHIESDLAAPNSNPGLYLRNLHGAYGVTGMSHPVFWIELVSGESPVNFEVKASPVLLELKAPDGGAEIYFDATDRIRFRTHGVSLRLTPLPNEVVLPKGNSHWEMHQLFSSTEKYTIWPSTGTLEVSGSWNSMSTDNPVATFLPDAQSHMAEGEIDTYDSVWTPPDVTTSFESGLQGVKNEYQRWLARMPEVSPTYGAGAELAAYVNWGAVVGRNGFLDRPTMLMSKHWMNMVWAWDHCFNAMALAEKDPELAWDQIMVFYDNQDANGAIPDEIRETIHEFTYTKPPVHGWALNWMMQYGQFSGRKHLEEVYRPLAKWTEWNFRYLDSNGNGLPEYNHGFDAGWDNSTIFLKGLPVEAPDMSSYLVLQMDALATIADKLGKKDEADEWRRRSQVLLKKLLDRFWKGDHFVAIRTSDDSVVESESLLLYMPIMLGNKLPPEVQQRLVEGLMHPGRFRTEHGFASEALTSSNYTPNGYWRGPIWASASMMLAEGLDSIGQKQIAHDIRRDFCDMAQKSGEMSENYDAKTGVPLRDPSYTWTSSVYLIFAHQLWMQDASTLNKEKDHDN
jgi:putative isomerase